MLRRLFNIGIGNVLFSVVLIAQGPQCTPPPSGMVAWYTGDDTANDFFGANNGTLQNGAGFAPGKVGQAFSLNGTNQFIGLPASVIPYPAFGASNNPPLSVDAWFQTTTGGVILGQQAVVSPPDAPTAAVPAIYVGTDGLLYAELFWKGLVGPISSAPRQVNDGVFHHVAVTYDGVNESVYLDGTLLGSAAITQIGYAASYQYQLGTGFTTNWPAAPSGYFYFQGLIDEVQFYNRALTQAEVLSIANASFLGLCRTVPPGACAAPPSGMVTWLTGDGTANDFLGANNGVLQNGATFAAGKVSQAFSLDGSSQFVMLPDNIIPYPTNGATSNQPLSVDAWFETTGGGVILGQQGAASPPATPNGAVPAIYVGTDGILYSELFWKGTPGPISSAPIKVNDGVFHHVAVTYDGANETVYLDGVSLGSVVFTQTGYASSYQYQLGTGFTAGWPNGNGTYFYFHGLIDEVQFFNRALTQTEVQSIVAAGSAGNCKTHAPVALCKNVVVSACMANASVDNGSFDPDGDPITLTQSPAGPYSSGTTSVTLTVTDNHGASSQCTATVTVNNSASVPVNSLTAAPSVLWPPNHKMIPVTLSVGPSGACAALSCKIVSVAANEPLQADDWVITGSLTLSLRAERSGNGSGRIYKITVECVDSAGNVSSQTVTVTVPHDQGGGDDNGDQGGRGGQDEGGDHGHGHDH